MYEVFGDDDHVAGPGSEVGHAFGNFGGEVVVVVIAVFGEAARVEVVFFVGEVGLVGAGYNDEPAISGVDIGQVEEKDQIVVVDLAILDKAPAPAR